MKYLNPDKQVTCSFCGDSFEIPISPETQDYSNNREHYVNKNEIHCKKCSNTLAVWNSNNQWEVNIAATNNSVEVNRTKHRIDIDVNRLRQKAKAAKDELKRKELEIEQTIQNWKDNLCTKVALETADNLWTLAKKDMERNASLGLTNFRVSYRLPYKEWIVSTFFEAVKQKVTELAPEGITFKAVSTNRQPTAIKDCLYFYTLTGYFGDSK